MKNKLIKVLLSCLVVFSTCFFVQKTIAAWRPRKGEVCKYRGRGGGYMGNTYEICLTEDEHWGRTPIQY